MARYILRNPFSTAKMHFKPGAGSVLYRSRMNKKQGGNFAALSPTDFIAAVTQHIPDKGFQLVRYYGWYSNKARGCPAKTGAGTGPGRRGTARTGSSAHLRPVAPAHCEDMGIRSLDLPRLRGRDESRLLHRRPRRREDSAAS